MASQALRRAMFILLGDEMFASGVSPHALLTENEYALHTEDGVDIEIEWEAPPPPTP